MLALPERAGYDRDVLPALPARLSQDPPDAPGVSVSHQRSLLIEEPPLQVLPKLAKIIGLNEAIILQQIHYWLGRSENVRDGRHWVYKTSQEWVDEFPFWSEATVKRAVAALKVRGLIVVGKESATSWNRTNWYSVDYEALGRIGAICADASDQIDTMHKVKMTRSIGSNCADRSDQIDPMSLTTEITTETTTDAFEIFWKALPKRAGNNPKGAALSAWRARVREKHTPTEMIEGASRYATFCRATGKEGTEYVLRASTFLGSDKPFLQSWDVPAAPGVAKDGWWSSPEATLAEANRRKLSSIGASWPELKARINAAIEQERHRVAA